MWRPVAQPPSREETSELPQHVETTVEAIAALHAAHETSANSSERLVDGITRALGQPLASFLLLGFVVVWISVNLALPAMGIGAIDKPPFDLLDLIVSLGAALTTIIILASQRRAEVLVTRHAQLALQLAFLGDQKQAKIIALLEELRRDDPFMKNRKDRQAEAMTRTADPKDVLDAIEETRDELVSTGEKGKE